MRFKATELLHIDVAPAFGVADVQQMYAALLAQLSPLSGRGKRDTHAAGQQAALERQTVALDRRVHGDSCGAENMLGNLLKGLRTA